MEKNDKLYNVSILLIGLLYLGEGLETLLTLLNPRSFSHHLPIPPNVAKTIQVCFILFIGLTYVLGSVGIFMHKEWGRRICLIFTYICGAAMLCKIILFCMNGLVPSLYSEIKLLLLIILPSCFLTRPKVKELFKK